MGLKQKKRAAAEAAVAAEKDAERAARVAWERSPAGREKHRKDAAEARLRGTWLLPFEKPKETPTLFGSENAAEVQNRCCCTVMLLLTGWPLFGFLLTDLTAPSWTPLATLRVLVLTGWFVGRRAWRWC